MTRQPELRTMLSDAVDEVIEDYENRAWILSSERQKPTLTANGRRAARRNLHALAAKHFASLIAEIRHLRCGPYVAASAPFTIPSESRRECAQCGNELWAGWVVCPKCGNRCAPRTPERAE